MPDGFVAIGDLGGGYNNPTPLTWYPQLMAQVSFWSSSRSSARCF